MYRLYYLSTCIKMKSFTCFGQETIVAFSGNRPAQYMSAENTFGAWNTCKSSLATKCSHQHRT
jgi:hypothetical protein